MYITFAGLLKFCHNRLAYPVYMLEKLKHYNSSHQIHFLYDVACLLETHLKVSCLFLYELLLMCSEYTVIEPWSN